VALRPAALSRRPLPIGRCIGAVLQTEIAVRSRSVINPKLRFWTASAPTLRTQHLPAPMAATHPRRARRLLEYFEERGLLVVRTDLRGRRALAFPDLGAETAAGDANAPDVVEQQAAAE
jgi:predicted phosphoadenosine phosphosulfate sulfurtransferase